MNPIPDKSLAYKDKISFLFQLFIKPGINFEKGNELNKEFVAANRLLKLFPDFDFFYSLNDLTGNFNSLLGLTGSYWKNRLLKRYDEFILEKDKNKIYPLSSQSVFDIKIEKQKPKNILEFINE